MSHYGETGLPGSPIEREGITATTSLSSRRRETFQIDLDNIGSSERRRVRYQRVSIEVCTMPRGHQLTARLLVLQMPLNSLAAGYGGLINLPPAATISGPPVPHPRALSP